MDKDKSVRNSFYNGSRIDDIELNGTIGPVGPQGPEGFSPRAYVEEKDYGARIVITDKDHGTTVADVFNGRDGLNGSNGQNGFSPLASVGEVEDGVQLTVTDNRGTTTAIIRNGERGPQGERGESALTFEVGAVAEGEQASVVNVGTDRDIVLDFVLPRGRDGEQGIQGPAGPEGQQGPIGPQGPQGQEGQQGIQGPAGADGFSPTVEVTETATGHTVTITDKDGWYSFDVENGVDGQNGQNGENGQNGADGAAATVQVGNVETLPAGSSAYVVNTGTENAAIFDFGIPKGADGASGGGESNFVLIDYSSVTYDVLLDYVNNNKVPYFYLNKIAYVLQYYSENTNFMTGEVTGYYFYFATYNQNQIQYRTISYTLSDSTYSRQNGTKSFSVSANNQLRVRNNQGCIVSNVGDVLGTTLFSHMMDASGSTNNSGVLSMFCKNNNGDANSSIIYKVESYTYNNVTYRVRLYCDAGSGDNGFGYINEGIFSGKIVLDSEIIILKRAFTSSGWGDLVVKKIALTDI